MLGDGFRFLDGKSDHIQIGVSSYTVRTRVAQPRTLSFLFGVLSFVSWVASADGIWEGTPRTRAEWFGSTAPVAPPLDDNARWARTGNARSCSGCTQNILSLIFDQPETPEAYPWASFTQVVSRQKRGDAVGHFVRMRDFGAWSAAFHAEHIAKTSGTSIGYSAEMSPVGGYTGRVIGVNLLAKHGYGSEETRPRNSSHAINIQTDRGVKWDVGINFDNARTNTGIAMHNQSICFDPANKTCLRWNPRLERLELTKNGITVQVW